MPKLNLITAAEIRGTWGDTLAMKGEGWEWNLQHSARALYDHYGVGPGKIGIHLAVGGSEPAATITNRGGAGSYFNAVVDGPAVPVSENYLVCSPTGGVPALLNPANLIGIRLIWVMAPQDKNTTYRVFGYNSGDGESSYIRRLSNNSNGTFQVWQRGPGIVTAPYYSPSLDTPTLYELEFTQATFEQFVNGISKGSTDHPFGDAYLLDRLGEGDSSFQKLEGLMGDVLGVTLGDGSADTIAAARRYLNQRFDLGLTL